MKLFHIKTQGARYAGIAALVFGLSASACGKKAPPPGPATTAPATTAPKAEDAAMKAEDAAAPKAEDAAMKAEDAAAPKAEDAAMKAEDAAAKPAGDAAVPAGDAAAAADAGAMITITSTSPEAVARFKEARDAFLAFDVAAGLAKLDAALALDPGFAQALAYKGSYTPGAAGLEMSEKAAAAASALPGAERAGIESMAADKRGDGMKALELTKKVAELAPGDWFAWFSLGQRYFAGDHAQARIALQHAIDLNPKAGIAYNLLGYIELDDGNKDAAIAALQKYVELTPNEPNPVDSLAEAQLGAGKLADAEATFAKAGAMGFPLAWYGAATARALQGNWKGAREAIDSGMAVAKQPDARSLGRMQIFFLALAQGDAVGADAAATDTEKAALADGLVADAFYARTDRVWMLLAADKSDDAAKALAAAEALADKGADAEHPALQGAELAAAHNLALLLHALIAGRSGKGDEATKAADALEAAAKTQPDGEFLRSLVINARGSAQLATDAKAAAETLAKCPATSYICQWSEHVALVKAGDAAGAAAVQKKLADTPRRDMDYVWIRAMVDKK